MAHPFQCVAVIAASEYPTLVVATGTEVLLTSSSNPRSITSWSTADQRATASTNGRPAKRQKINYTAATQAPSIIEVTAAPDQSHVVVATEDKNIHVLELKPEGQLERISQRCMPKRPCATQISPDSKTIFIGDKFGDVYALPLLMNEEDELKFAAMQHEQTVAAKARFTPSANNFTIHTERNRVALEHQRNQKQFTPRKEPLQFQHQFLLGHVSMLTDVLLATRIVEGNRRKYILTADRDEHIRISRAPPQSHIIEGFCLGHTEFVSRICLIPGTDYLISGGGDTWLGFWDWPAGKLLHKIDLWPLLEGLENAPAKSSEAELTVSGLEVVSVTPDEPALVIVLERIGGLFLIPLSGLIASPHAPTTFQPTVIPLPTYPIHVASTLTTIVVSLDARQEGSIRLQGFALAMKPHGQQGTAVTYKHVTQDGHLGQQIQALNDTTTLRMVNEKTINDLLYNISNLRKRTGWPDAGPTADAAEEGEDAVEDGAD